MKSTLRALMLLAVGTMLAPASALCAEPEKVVVRNRLYVNEGRFEASASAGLSVVNYLTRHTNLTASLAYNVTEQWAVELVGGYALSSQTNVAEAASNEVVQSNPASQQKTVDDFEDLWQMTWNVGLAARWAPIYGKMNVAAELPVHFNAYLLAGAGLGGMERDSLVYCIGDVDDSHRKLATCRPDGSGDYSLTPLHSSQVKPIFMGGLGFRFIVNEWAGLRIEVRDMAFPDSYRVDIARAAAEKDFAAKDGGDQAATQGQPASNPGLTHLVLFNIGATFSF
ncbi:MAG: outer membrane beta-barrel domain-containing protein [Myxococcales bacterium]|jgi:outer membrane beta-barrel protein